METIALEDRKKLTVKGATKIFSSTSTQAVVEVDNCNIVIGGTNIEVTRLDLDNKEVVFAGEITQIKYCKKTEKVGLLKRLFK